MAQAAMTGEESPRAPGQTDERDKIDLVGDRFMSLARQFNPGDPGSYPFLTDWPILPTLY